ncbi:MAG TPA: hypothetical protein VMJ64_00250 [Anaerolineales bacterium]|nr:hypothetical protein [Anaerolineales bacterium]
MQAQLPLPLLVTIQLIPQMIGFARVAGAGLFFANQTGLGLPILEAKLRGEPRPARLRSIVPIGVILGVLAGLVIVALDAYIFQPAVQAQLDEAASALASAAIRPAPWKGFLASF